MYEWWAESESRDAHCIKGFQWLGPNEFHFDGFCGIRFVPNIHDKRIDYDLVFHCRDCIREIKQLERLPD